ncbi:MAG: CHAT domain-containing protein [Bernardetiaceae bacterium]|nr:CHAT domain-containing protein [Bernardetiaceae bacterium]
MKPVIFIGFANDQQEAARYLRNLPKELAGLRKALQKAEQAGLCQVVERANLSAENLVDVFQEYGERVCVFHYGGHADGYQLLLEDFSGSQGGNQVAHGAGLVSFLAKQRGLRLVFFNGCSTQQQTQELIRAGIPAVVGTDNAIADDTATDLAVRFYTGLANGLTLERAWAEAVDLITIRHGATNLRGMYRPRPAEEPAADRLPWDLYYREGSEAVKDWNLPVAAQNPLFGLPDIPAGYPLPAQPFRYLKRYEREDARVFFGRSYYISALYKLITDRKAPPVVLMYGQTGVGKSSLLDAGVLPRLEANYDVVYIRRIQERGLLGTLQEAVGLSQERLNVKQMELIAADYQGELQVRFAAFIEHLKTRLEAARHGALSESQVEDYLLSRNLCKFWQSIEREIGRPLVVILDQVEEMFTRPMPPKAGAPRPEPGLHPHPEFAPFLETVRQVFANPADMPRGKLVLSYRKEYHPEIEEALKLYGIARSTLFLEQLKARDVEEIVQAFGQRPELQQAYGIKITDGLAKTMGEDFTSQADAPVALLLQIALSRLWEEHANAPDRHFGLDDYALLQRYGISIYDFFIQQIKELQAWRHDLVDSGFVLDLLRYFITPAGTAASRRLDDLRREYRHRQEDLVGLLERASQLSLLVAPRPDTYQLAHDTLAPEVLREHTESDKEAQRALRILSSKLADIESVRGNEELDKEQQGEQVRAIVIEENDLAIVERGLDWMRQTGGDEQLLIERSRGERRRRRDRRRWLYGALVVLGLGILVTIAFGLVQRQRTFRALARAQASQLLGKAIQAEETNPTRALRLAEVALSINPSLQVEKDLVRIFGSHQFYFKKVEFDPKWPTLNLAPSPDGTKFAAISPLEDYWPHLLDASGRELLKFRGSPHQALITGIAFSPDGQRILTGSEDSTARLWSVNGELLATLKYHRGPLTFVGFSPDGSRLLTGGQDRAAALWDLDGRRLAFFPDHEGPVSHVAASADGALVLSTSIGQSAVLRLWDVKGRAVRTWEPFPEQPLSVAAFAPNSRFLLVATQAYAQIVDLEGNVHVQFQELTNVSNISGGGFINNGRTVLISADRSVLAWNLTRELGQNQQTPWQIAHFKCEEGAFMDALYPLPQPNRFISRGSGAFYFWQIEGYSDLLAPGEFLHFAGDMARNLLLTVQVVDSGFVEMAWHKTDLRTRTLRDSSRQRLLGDAHNNLAIAPDLGHLAYLAGADSLVLAPTDGTAPKVVRLGSSLLLPPKFASQDSLVAVALGSAYAQANALQVYDREGRPVADLAVPAGFYDFALLPGRRLAVAQTSGVQIWDLKKGALLNDIPLPLPIHRLEALSSGRLVAICQGQKRFYLVNPVGPAVVEVPVSQAVLDLTTDPTREQFMLLYNGGGSQAEHFPLVLHDGEGYPLATHVLSARQIGTQYQYLMAITRDGGHFLALTEQGLMLQNLQRDLFALLASDQVARFSAIDFAEAEVPVENRYLDTLKSPAELTRVAKFYLNEEDLYDFTELDELAQLERAEYYFQKSLAAGRTPEALQGLAKVRLLRDQPLDLLALFTKNATLDELRSHNEFLRLQLANDTLRATYYAKALQEVAVRGLRQLREPNLVGGLLEARRALGEPLPAKVLDTLVRTDNPLEMRKYAELLANDQANPRTRKDLALRSVQLYTKLLKLPNVRTTYEDSTATARTSARLASYHLLDGELLEAERRLGQVALLDPQEPSQPLYLTFVYLLTGRPEQAKALYFTHRGQPYDPSGYYGAPTNRPFEQVFAQQLRVLVGRGLVRPAQEATVSGWK